MQDDCYFTNLEKTIAILQGDKKYFQEENEKLKIELEESIEKQCKLKAEINRINDLLNIEIEKNKINQNHIEQLKKEPELQNDDSKHLNQQKKYGEKFLILEQKILKKCDQIKMDEERQLEVKFHEFLNKLEKKFNQDKQKYFEKYQLEKQIQEEKIKELYEEIKKYIQEIVILNKQLDKLQMEGKHSNLIFNESKILDQRLQIQNNFENEMITKKKNQDNLEQRNLEQRNKEQNRLNRLNGLQENKELQQLRQYQENEQNKNTIKQMFRHIKKSHGFVEICFLLDITASMDPYKQQAKKCIQDSIKQIKMHTQKDAKWSVIGYQDFGELKQLGSQYRQLQFTQDSNLVEEFLDSLVCAGGSDEAEDIRGGMKQMVKNLEWEKEFRLAILICDAPTHGMKYNGGVSDRYPNEDIEDAILQLIEKNIFLMVVKFNPKTEVMYSEIKKIYQAQGKPDLLLVEDAQGIGISNLSNLFANKISNATPQRQIIRKHFKKVEIISAMENLCKKETDPVNFDQDPDIQVIDTQFEVFNVELSDQYLENHKYNIKGLNTENCFKPIKEPGFWDCKRTANPFAAGSLKQVFLMKKKDNPTELYAIKMPLGDKTYESIEKAVKDCRSHLIAKGLLEKFITDLEKNQKEDAPLNIPDVQYTNILILKDLKKKDSFWVAERYFSGKFVKYNNNSAFISDDSNSLNHLMQAFSYYTFYKSNLNYIICDVQGIGQYMTDPAINTKEGNFDETDIGDVGIKSYLGSYQGKSHLGREYLKCLNIPDFEDI